MSRLLNQSLLNLATILKLHHRSSDKILKVFIPGKIKRFRIGMLEIVNFEVGSMHLKNYLKLIIGLLIESALVLCICA